MNIVFKTGNERPLEERHFLPLAKENTSCFVTENFKQNGTKKNQSAKETGKDQSSGKALLRCSLFMTLLFSL